MFSTSAVSNGLWSDLLYPEDRRGESIAFLRWEDAYLVTILCAETKYPTNRKNIFWLTDQRALSLSMSGRKGCRSSLVHDMFQAERNENPQVFVSVRFHSVLDQSTLDGAPHTRAQTSAHWMEPPHSGLDQCPLHEAPHTQGWSSSVKPFLRSHPKQIHTVVHP